jgi:hypothetical protein
MQPADIVNLGGFGVLALVLLKLHRDALDAFRTELAAERKQRHTDHEAILKALKGLTDALRRRLRRRPRKITDQPDSPNGAD